jgi:hypothetical protein
MKKWISLLIFPLAFCLLTACTYDTFTVNSTANKFKPKTVTSIVLAGPDVTGQKEDGIEVELTADGNANFAQLMQLIQGKKTDTCETDAFGLCYVNFTFSSGDETKVYPANDGSNYICLYSLNPQLARYIALEEEEMNQVVAILEGAGIQVVY